MRQPERKSSSDQTDKRILFLLQGNARMSFQKLGEHLGISRVAAMKRVRKLELSVRSYNCLKRAGISTVGDLVNRIDSGSDLLKIRNLGQRSASEIMLCLFLNNYMYLKPEKRKGYLEKVKKLNMVTELERSGI